MKRTTFVKTVVSGMAAVLLSTFKPGNAVAVVPPAATPTQLDYLALDVVIKAINEFMETGDKYAWPYIYGRLGETHLDSSWPTAQKVGNQVSALRNELISRANNGKNNF